ncbi:PD-(D/E)XK nuclease family transposase [bacterium A37T11]|nr:PD-(D/E)XK nuclease family transposase [bacterium A37T11]
MQRALQEFFKVRSVVYTSRQISFQAPKGRMKIWNYNLKEVYLVALLDNFTMPNSVPEHYIHDICLMDRETKEVFYEKLGYIYIELINFVKTEEELETDLDDWLYSLRHLSKLKKLPRVLNKPVFKRLFNIAEYNNLTDEERMLYDTELQKRWDNQNALDFKLKQGLEQGLEQGRREERAKADQEIAKLKARAEADKLKAEAEKLETASSIKKLGVLSNLQIAEKFHLPLDVVEKL